MFAGNETGGGSEYLARRGTARWWTESVGLPAGFPVGEACLPRQRRTLMSRRTSNRCSPGDSSAPTLLDPKKTKLTIRLRDFSFIGRTCLTRAKVGNSRVRSCTGRPQLGIALTLTGASPDFCHTLFESTSPLLAGVEGKGQEAYELDRGCDGGPGSLQLIGLNDESAPKLINASCENAEVGAQEFAVSQNFYNTISADGSEVFFMDCLGPEPSTGGSNIPHQLFLRLGETHSIEVSKPLAESDSCAELSACEVDAARPVADLAGASQDGATVYFSTADTLTPGDMDTSTNLFVARIGCPEGGSTCGVPARRVTSLVQVSHGPHAGDAAEVQGVVRVAPDGSRVYFVARGMLSETANAQGASPASGADNL